MKFKIYGVDSKGIEDSIILEGDTIEDIQQVAEDQVIIRNWVEFWSEKIE